MFKREENAGRLLGYSLQHKHAFFFFGTKEFKREDLWTLFPEYDFAFLKQVHGKAVVQADPATECEADAHFTRMVTRALVVQTADCVPVLLASKNKVCAIHAGWRGVAQNIIGETKAWFRDDPVLFAAIGPHIMGSGENLSFEVGEDVAKQLIAASTLSATKARSYLRAHPTPGKTYFDLTQLVRDQLTNAYGGLTPGSFKVFECLHDTMASADFHSFRRDGKQAGRQYSFVVLNS